MATLDKADRVDQAEGAKDAAAEAVDDVPAARVMPLSEMLQLIDDGKQAELDEYLAERGTVVDWEALDDRVLVAMGTDALAIERGTPLSPARQERVRAASEKALVQIAREEANTLMAREEQRAMFAADPRPDDEKMGRWCAICSGSCDDCVSLHGVVLHMDEWEGISPSDGVNQCEKKCRCRILPCGGTTGQT